MAISPERVREEAMRIVTFTVEMNIRLSLWSAIKLRIAGIKNMVAPSVDLPAVSVSSGIVVDKGAPAAVPPKKIAEPGPLPENRIDAEQCAEMLNCSVVTVYSRARKGDIPYSMDGKKLVFDPEVIKTLKFPPRRPRGPGKAKTIEARNPWPEITQKF
jgi:hypothetical protein